MEFTRLVSLGFRCRTGFRLRQYFGVSETYPFDWWIISAEGVLDFLADWDVDRLFDADAMEVFLTGDGVGWIDQPRYGVRFFHDFPKVGKLMTLHWRDHLPDARSRTAHLMDKFRKLDRPGERILFVREMAPWETLSPPLLERLRGEIRRALPLADCHFLLISPDGAAVDGWEPLKIDDPAQEPWTGDQGLWDSALATLGHRVRSPTQVTT